MALPQQVQDQLAAAEALLNGGESPAPETQADDQVQHVDPPEPAPREEPVEHAAPEPTRTQRTESDWEHKYKVLQGMFNKQARESQEQQRAVAELQAKLEQVSKRQPEPQEQAQKPVVEGSDIDNFGQDVMDMIHRVSAQHVSQAVSTVQQIAQELVARIQRLEQGVGEVTQATSATAEGMFFERLALEVPDWEQANQDENFIAWLEDVDPVFGSTRMTALTQARQALDSSRVSYIFKSYLRDAASAKSNRADPLSKQLTPRAAASAAPGSNAKSVVSQGEIVAFYNDVSRGVFRGREAEMARIENEINLAIAEGRVAP